MRDGVISNIQPPSPSTAALVRIAEPREDMRQAFRKMMGKLAIQDRSHVKSWHLQEGNSLLARPYKMDLEPLNSVNKESAGTTHVL